MGGGGGGRGGGGGGGGLFTFSTLNNILSPRFKDELEKESLNLGISPIIFRDKKQLHFLMKMLDF